MKVLFITLLFFLPFNGFVQIQDSILVYIHAEKHQNIEVCKYKKLSTRFLHYNSYLGRKQVDTFLISSKKFHLEENGNLYVYIFSHYGIFPFGCWIDITIDMKKNKILVLEYSTIYKKKYSYNAYWVDKLPLYIKM